MDQKITFEQFLKLVKKSNALTLDLRGASSHQVINDKEVLIRWLTPSGQERSEHFSADNMGPIEIIDNIARFTSSNETFLVGFLINQSPEMIDKIIDSLA